MSTSLRGPRKKKKLIKDVLSEEALVHRDDIYIIRASLPLISGRLSRRLAARCLINQSTCRAVARRCQAALAPGLGGMLLLAAVQ